MLEICAKGREQYTERPASYADPVDLPALQEKHAELIRSETDLMLLALFPNSAKGFLRARQTGG